MYSVDQKQFSHGLEIFIEKAISEQQKKFGTSELSFSKGYLYEQEGYKYQLFNKAHILLDAESWKRSDVGTGRIIEKVIATFHVKAGDQVQNIIDWRDVERAEEIFSKRLKESEIMLFNLFCEGDEEESFGSAIELLGQCYAVITYLFFLKDCEKYVPVRTRHFKEQFAKLGISTAALDECTWRNYQEFNEIVTWVKNAIASYFPKVSLLDAHSFIWMMWLFDEESVLLSPKIGSPKWFYDKAQNVTIYCYFGSAAHMYAKAKEIPYELFDKRNIAEASAVPEYTVTGFNRKAHTPSVSITYGEDVLPENTDFTLEYTNNTEAGTATITVTGCGDYKGAQILEFAIKNILGDADGDGSVDAVDVTVILRYLVRIKVNDPDRVALAGNVTRSGVLDITDATFIRRWIVGVDIPYMIDVFMD